MPEYNFKNSFVASAMTLNGLPESVFCLFSSQKVPHFVAFVEPLESLKSMGNANDTSHIRALVSFALNLSTESPITLVSKYDFV